jgi:branched-chain amino acid transport system permease protein
VSRASTSPGRDAPVTDPELVGVGSRRTFRAQAAAWLALAAVLAVFPVFFTNAEVTSIAVFTLIFMTAATAWNTFSGFSGYLSLGHAAFFGTGAYTLCLLADHLGFAGGYGVFWLVPLAGLVAAAAAVPYGLIALRTRRHTFVVITIAIFFIFQLLAFNLSFTGGSSGAAAPVPPWIGGSYNDRFYYAALVCLVLAVGIAILVRRSRFGLQLLAIRDDEDRALGLGVNVMAVKMTGFAISSFAIGACGAIYALYIGQVYPAGSGFAFDPLFDLSIAMMSFLGGLGTLVGPLLGALILESAQQYLTVNYSNGSLYLILLGALFLGVFLLMPQGIIPYVRDRVTKRADREKAQVADTELSMVGGDQ